MPGRASRQKQLSERGMLQIVLSEKFESETWIRQTPQYAKLRSFFDIIVDSLKTRRNTEENGDVGTNTTETVCTWRRR